MRSDGMSGTVVCAKRGLDVPLTPPGQGLRRTWEPNATRPSWHPDDCASPCCGRWRAVTPELPRNRSARPGTPVGIPEPAPAAGDGPIPCEVCGRGMTRDYVLRTGLRRHGDHLSPASRQETRA